MLALLLSLVGPDLNKLGADEYETREAEHRRCDNLLTALLLPWSHQDPEVNHRITELRRRNLRFLRAEFIERVVCRDDFKQWFDLWFQPNRSRIALEDVYFEAFADIDKARVFANRWGVAYVGEWCPFPFVLPVAFDEFRDHCDYHRGIAPHPREK